MVPEAADGGTIALVCEGDIISIDIPNRSLALNVSDEELEKRRASLVIKEKELSGYIKRYQSMVTSASQGAVYKF